MLEPTEDARTMASDLVTIGKDAYDPDPTNWSPSDAWVAAGVSGDAISGTGITADGTETLVSGFEFVTDKATDQEYLAFAVADTKGGCAYGYLISTGSAPEGSSLAADGACTGDAAATAFNVG